MTAEITQHIKVTAADPKAGITVSQLRDFLAAIDASGTVPDTVPLRARVGWKAQIHSLEIGPR